MRIVSRSCTETTCIVQTGQNKVKNSFAREGIRFAEQMACSQAPVYSIKTKMFSQPVFELIFALQVGRCQSSFKNMAATSE